MTQEQEPFSTLTQAVEAEHPELSRRRLLKGAGGALALLATDSLFLARPAFAASIEWNHPFTVRGTKGDLFGWISDGNGGYRNHHGLDYKLPGRGTPIYSVAAGTVTASTTAHHVYGTYVEIDHGTAGDHAYSTYYGHMLATYVKKGQKIPAETLIGKVGNTKGPALEGISVGNHLHISLLVDGVLKDPAPAIHGAPLAKPNQPEREQMPKFDSMIDDRNRVLKVNTWTPVHIEQTGVRRMIADEGFVDAQLNFQVENLPAGAVLSARFVRLNIDHTVDHNYQEVDTVSSGLPDTFGQIVEKIKLGSDKKLYACAEVMTTTPGVSLVRTEVRYFQWVPE